MDWIVWVKVQCSYSSADMMATAVMVVRVSGRRGRSKQCHDAEEKEGSRRVSEFLRFRGLRGVL